jgi:hypothetical protein
LRGAEEVESGGEVTDAVGRVKWNDVFGREEDDVAIAHEAFATVGGSKEVKVVGRHLLW